MESDGHVYKFPYVPVAKEQAFIDLHWSERSADPIRLKWGWSIDLSAQVAISIIISIGITKIPHSYNAKVRCFFSGSIWKTGVAFEVFDVSAEAPDTHFIGLNPLETMVHWLQCKTLKACCSCT